MSERSQDTRGRKPRNYYVDYTKGGDGKFRDRRRGHTSGFSNNSRYREAPDIAFGHRGFLITSVDEVKCYLEMRNILEEYHELLYKQENPVVNEHETTEDEIERELKVLRKNRPFKQVKTHCRNTLFINIMPDFSYIDPTVIVDKFFNDLADKRQIKTSNTFKVLPVLDTFRSSVSCAKESLANLIRNHLKDEPDNIKYFIEFQSRGNYKLNPEDKQKMIEGIAETVSELRPLWSVDRDNSNFIVVIAALKNVCCVSILKDYFKRCKYNVLEFCKDFNPTETESPQETKPLPEEESAQD